METLVTEEFPHVVRPGTEPGPGILVFHGWGHNEQVMLKKIQQIDERLTIVVPRGPIDTGNGFGWYWRRNQIIADRSSFDDVVERLDLFVQNFPQQYQIDPTRLIVLGFSQGAGLATSLTRMNATRFAGTVSLSGPPLPIPLLHEAPELMVGHPVFIAHGVNDDTILPVNGHMVRDEMIERGATVTFREYSYRHEIRPETVADLNFWIQDVLGRRTT